MKRRLNPVFATFVSILALGATSPAAMGQTGEDASPSYARCIDLVKTAPGAAMDMGLALDRSGAKLGSRHCQAMALIRLQQYATAAGLLESLARSDDPAIGDRRAGLWAQTGQALSLAGQPGRAIAAFSEALRLNPADRELFIDRAIARFDAGQYQASADDLGQAIAAFPTRSQPYLLRARALRKLGEMAAALVDVEEVLVMEPMNAQAFFERGLIRELSDAHEASRLDWQHVIEIAPASRWAELARENLRRSDAAEITPVE